MEMKKHFPTKIPFDGAQKVVKEAKKFATEALPNPSGRSSSLRKTVSSTQIVHQIFANMGYQFTLTELINWPPIEFDLIHDNEVRPGDIILFQDNIGIVTGSNQIVTCHKSSGPQEVFYGPKHYWGSKKMILKSYRWVGLKSYIDLLPGEKALKKSRLYEGWTWVLGNNPLKKTIDCSNLVHQAFLDSGFNFIYVKTAKWPPKEFEKIEEKEVKIGDIVLFKGHVGIISGIAKYFGSQTSTGPKEIVYGSDTYWGKDRKLLGFYRWSG